MPCPLLDSYYRAILPYSMSACDSPFIEPPDRELWERIEAERFCRSLTTVRSSICVRVSLAVVLKYVTHERNISLTELGDFGWSAGVSKNDIEKYIDDFYAFIMRYKEDIFVSVTEREIDGERGADQLFELRAYNVNRSAPALESLLEAWREDNYKHMGHFLAPLFDQLGATPSQQYHFAYRLQQLQETK